MTADDRSPLGRLIADLTAERYARTPRRSGPSPLDNRIALSRELYACADDEPADDEPADDENEVRFRVVGNT